MRNTKSEPQEVSPKQKLIFKFIVIFIPIIFLLSFEGLLRLSGYGDNLNLFVENPIEGYEDYLAVNPKIGKKYFQKFEYNNPTNDIFLKKKPEGSFRIFVMGSSTVVGFPYENNLMFSRILNKRLEDTYDTKKIEVINTAITAINSFTLADYIDEILKYEPDAILIYAGHNEFYGAFGIGSNETMSKYRWLTKLHINLLDYRIYQLIRNLITDAADELARKNDSQSHGTLMKRIVADKDILFNSEEYNIAMERYRQNMGDILVKAQNKKVPVFISQLVCNVKDLKPFNSIKNDTLEAAADVYNKAIVAEKNGDFADALKLYYKAKDLDCIRFRASEDINIIIEDLSNEYRAKLVPMLSAFQNHSPNKLIGDNLMTEHLHPNIEGYFLMSEAFYAELIKSGLLGERNDLDPISLEYFKKSWGYTALDSLLGYHRVNNLKNFWPFVLDDKDGSNYRKFYQPKSSSDSLVFTIIRNPKLKLIDLRYDLAKKYEKNGQIYEAYREYEAIIRTNPYLAASYRDAATSLLQLSDLPLALKYFLKSLEFDSDSFYANFKIAEIYLIMSDYSNAIKYFQKSYPLAPIEKRVNVLAKSYMACVYLGKTDDAKKIATELNRVNASQYLKIPPKSYVFNNYIPFVTKSQIEEAEKLISMNKIDEAISILENSLKIYDSHIAKKYLGELYFRQQNTIKAETKFKKVYNLFRFDPKFLNDYCLISIANKDFEKAKIYLNEIKLIDPDNNQINELSLIIK